MKGFWLLDVVGEYEAEYWRFEDGGLNGLVHGLNDGGTLWGRWFWEGDIFGEGLLFVDWVVKDEVIVADYHIFGK